jgi:hypothetical protein
MERRNILDNKSNERKSHTSEHGESEKGIKITREENENKKKKGKQG